MKMDYLEKRLGFFLGLCLIVIFHSGKCNGKVKEVVHGHEKDPDLWNFQSPNHYYLMYKNMLLAGDEDAKEDIILRHPALPIDVLKGENEEKPKLDKPNKEDLTKKIDCENIIMKDPKNKMNSGMKAMMCDMYEQWGHSMEGGKDWKPSEAQQEWWDSLGVEKQSMSDDEARARRQLGRDRALRREYRTLTDAERGQFHQAVNTLKNTYMDGQSKYDVFVRHHQARQAPGAHFGPGFYGWHREMLFRLVAIKTYLYSSAFGFKLLCLFADPGLGAIGIQLILVLTYCLQHLLHLMLGMRAMLQDLLPIQALTDPGGLLKPPTTNISVNLLH